MLDNIIDWNMVIGLGATFLIYGLLLRVAYKRSQKKTKED